MSPKELFFAHKNLFITFVAALVIIGGGLFLSHPEFFTWHHDVKIAQQTSTTTLAANEDPLNHDSDNDGLPDWEERLYGTDPQNPDSDGDGTTDGEEVRLGRNPAKANTAGPGQPPNDMLPYIQDPHFATSSTDVLGIKKEFFAKFLTTEGRKIKETTFQDLVKKIDVKKFAPKNQLIDLNISSDNSPETIHTYGNAFGELIVKYTKRNYRTEQEVLKDAMQSSSTEKLKDLQLPALGYKNFAEDLKALPTPSSLAKSHLTIVNGYMGMYQALLSLEQMYIDPMEGAAGYQAYAKGIADVTDGYAQLIYLFAQANVTFTPKEPGYPFYKYTPKQTATTTTSAM